MLESCLYHSEENGKGVASVMDVMLKTVVNVNTVLTCPNLGGLGSERSVVRNGSV